MLLTVREKINYFVVSESIRVQQYIATQLSCCDDDRWQTTNFFANTKPCDLRVVSYSRQLNKVLCVTIGRKRRSHLRDYSALYVRVANSFSTPTSRTIYYYYYYYYFFKKRYPHPTKIWLRFYMSIYPNLLSTSWADYSLIETCNKFIITCSFISIYETDGNKYSIVVEVHSL